MFTSAIDLALLPLEKRNVKASWEENKLDAAFFLFLMCLNHTLNYIVIYETIYYNTELISLDKCKKNV